MSQAAQIIVYGEDRGLLESRTWVLQRAGFNASLAPSLGEVEELIRGKNFALVVLCHTLSLEQRERAIELIRRVGTYVWALILDTHHDSASSSHYARVSAASGPQAMIDTINELVERAPRTLAPIKST